MDRIKIWSFILSILSIPVNFVLPETLFMLTRPRVKICCIASAGDARVAVECGASAVGLVSEMPSGPGVISEE